MTLPADCRCLEDQPEGAHAFIQWKGTDACIDIWCECGAAYHSDGEEFLYSVQCSACGAIYEMDSYVRMRRRSEECQWHRPIPLLPDRWDMTDMAQLVRL